MVHKTNHAAFTDTLLQQIQDNGFHLSASYLLCWGAGMELEGRSSLCPRALIDVWLDVVSNEAGPEPLSAKVPMLETDDGVTESEAGFTDTAEPEEAIKWNIVLTFVDQTQMESNFTNVFKMRRKINLPSTDGAACIEL